MSRPTCFPSKTARPVQRGVSLIFSMIALVALSLAAVALIRAVNTGSGILGNLGFKQDTLLAADDATRLAIEWLNGQLGSTTLHNDLATGGYYAANRSELDPTGAGTSATRTLIGWEDATCGGHSPCILPFAAVKLEPSKHVEARYVILRLCDGTGNPAAPASTLHCATPLAASKGAATDKNAPTSSNPQRAATTVQSQYYRIVVRAKGSRNTLSYTDTVVHF